MAELLAVVAARLALHGVHVAPEVLPQGVGLAEVAGAASIVDLLALVAPGSCKHVANVVLGELFAEARVQGEEGFQILELAVGVR
eukprot:3781096-Alexandrium_andersonii.AAC.1